MFARPDNPGNSKIIIDEKEIEVNDELSILEVANKVGIHIPSLCFHPALGPLPEVFEASSVVFAGPLVYQSEKDSVSREEIRCGLCLVEINGPGGQLLDYACTTRPRPGMRILTNSPRIQELRKERLLHILHGHPFVCLTCDRDPRCPPFGVCVRSATVENRCVTCPTYPRCELLRLADDVKIVGRAASVASDKMELLETPIFTLDPNLCVGCLRCIRACYSLGGKALTFAVANGKIRVGWRMATPREAGCRFCGACVESCPTGALLDNREKWQPVIDLRERPRFLVPCVAACPLEIDIPRYVGLLASGDYWGAADTILEKLPLPLTCATVCPSPCEEACRRGDIDEPVAIRHLKKVAIERALEEDPVLYYRKFACRRAGNSEKIAVIGSGPSGLTAAYLLAIAGYSVTVFERLEVLGGMLAVGIPRFRLPEIIVRQEIEALLTAGIEVKTGYSVESLDFLFELGFKAILVATGCHEERKLEVDGGESPGVVGALSMFRILNTGGHVVLGSRVLVVGGGDVAIDAARAALRLGAEHVVVCYRKSKSDMRARKKELMAAEREGVRVVAMTRINRIRREKDMLAVLCSTSMPENGEWTGFDIVFRSNDRTQFLVFADTVVAAVGQNASVPQGYNLRRNPDGTVWTDPFTLMTSRNGVFACGDVVSGPRNVPEAVAMGRRAAVAIDSYLGGNRLRPGSTWIGTQGRPPLAGDSRMWTHRRLHCINEPFGDEDQLGSLSQEELLSEAMRCLRCDLRLPLMRS